MTTRTATCVCRQLRVTVQGEPIRVSLCNCLECQRRTGSLFGEQARWPRERATFEGATKEFRRCGDEGHFATFRFCPDCGATVWWSFDEGPDVIAVAVGAFADPEFPKPEISVYDNRRHRWLDLPPDLPRD